MAERKTKYLKCQTDLKPWAQSVEDEEPRPYEEGEVGHFDTDQAKMLIKAGFFMLWDDELGG